MEWGIITGITGAIVGALGLCIAVFANSQAKKANQLSKTANEIASQALNTAVESNEIAENANKFSQESNALFERQLRQDTESHFVNWECGWNVEEASIRIKNLGSDTAYEVSVIVTADNFHQVSNWTEIEANIGGVSIPIDDFVEKRILFNKEAEVSAANARAAGFIGMVAIRYKRTFNVVITWQSALGIPSKFTTEIKAR